MKMNEYGVQFVVKIYSELETMENTDTSLVCVQNQRQWKRHTHGFGLWGVMRVLNLFGR